MMVKIVVTLKSSKEETTGVIEVKAGVDFHHTETVKTEAIFNNLQSKNKLFFKENENLAVLSFKNPC